MAFLAPLAVPLLEGVGAEAAGGLAAGAAGGAAAGAGAAGAAEGGGMLGGIGGFMGDHPFLMGNLMGRAMGGGGAPGQAMMGPSPGASVAEPAGVTGKVGADMFGEDEVGMATQNRGENSDPDSASSTGIAGEAEHGDSPEQNKSVGLGQGGGQHPFAADALHDEGGADDGLRDTATNAFHSNLPLILEFAFSDESGADHPILKALDGLLEQAFPGYKDADPMHADMDSGADTTETGMSPHDPENPTEKLEEDLGQDLDSDGPADTPESKEDDEKEPKVAGYGDPDSLQTDYRHRRDTPVGTRVQFLKPHWYSEGVPAANPGDQGVIEGNTNAGFSGVLHHVRLDNGTRVPNVPGSYIEPSTKMEDPFAGLPVTEEREAAVRIAREAGYCPDCWGPLDVLKRCASCKTTNAEGPWDVGHRVRHVDSPHREENFATIVNRKDTPYGYAYDLKDPRDGSIIPDVPHNSDLVYVDAGKPEPNYMPPTGPDTFNKFPNIQPGDVEHFDPKYFPKDASTFHEADVPGPPSSVGMGNAMDTGAATNITGIPTCPLCHQNHVAGTPCPTPQMQAPTPPATEVSPTNTGFAIPMQPSKVVTKVSEYDDSEVDREPDPMHNESYEDGETPETGWYEDWKGPDQEKHPWVDDKGEPLQDGGTYEMHSTGYAIPDKIKVLAVTPNKLSYELEAGDIAYKDTITTDDVYKQGYSFQKGAPDDDPGMESQPEKRSPYETGAHPTPPRPGDDALPQHDDISSPPTRVSHQDELDAYLGSFRGDSPDSRNWLNDPGPGQGVDIDPVTMAKIAGKDFSPREQRQFIDETGTARNLHRLDLEGTHYELEDYGDSLW